MWHTLPGHPGVQAGSGVLRFSLKAGSRRLGNMTTQSPKGMGSPSPPPPGAGSPPFADEPVFTG